MKADNEYLKTIFDIFWNHPKHYIKLGEIESAGIDIRSEKFMFHINLLMEGGFADHKSGTGWLHSFTGTDELHQVNTGAKLILTNNGHDFAEALNTSDVWNLVKSDVKEMSYGNLSKLVKAYTEGWMKKKAEKYLGEYQPDDSPSDNS